MKHTLLWKALPCLLMGPGLAQDKEVLDHDQRTEVVQNIARELVEGYIYEDVGKALALHLETRLEEGAYDEIEDRAGLANQLTSELYELSSDKHLRIRPVRSSSGAGAQGGPRRMVRRVPGGGDGDGAGGPAWPGAPDFPRVNHGFQELRILEGNVGYLDLRLFSPSADALARVDAAMSFFDSVDAMIIDLGQNGGGAGTIITYFSGYFFDERTHMLDRFQRGMEQPEQRWSDETVQGRKRPDMPLFILTSPRTGSAAESFTFGLKVKERVTLIGEGTGGAGHFGRGMQPLAHGFEMFLPVGRVYDPETDKGFEVEGIAPDVEVPYSEALATAHDMAVDAGREYMWAQADK